jgi:hypothetical protein
LLFVPRQLLSISKIQPDDCRNVNTISRLIYEACRHGSAQVITHKDVLENAPTITLWYDCF